MGNRCVTCLRPERRSLRDCFGCSKRKDKGRDLKPADLHSSSACQKATSKASLKDRPETLEVKASMHSNDMNKLNSKFSDFSLHGIQKSSPLTPSTSSSPLNTEIAVKQPFSPKKLELLFEAYLNEDNCILAEGIEALCDDLEVDPMDFIVLVFAWKLKAKTMCKFTREEFITGCTEMQVDSISAIKALFPALVLEAKDNFKNLYKFAFQFGLDSEAGQRSLPADIAVELWNLVFVNNKPELLDPWLNFITEEKIRGVSRDTWMMFLHFTEVVGSDLSKYDDSEAWPSVFDDFVEKYKELEENRIKQALEDEKISTNIDINCEKELEAESTINDILPPPYDPPPYTSKEHLAQLPEENDEEKTYENRDVIDAKQQHLQNIIASSSSDISNTSVEIPGTIKSSGTEKTDEKTDPQSVDSSEANNTEPNDEAVRIDTLHSS